MPPPSLRLRILRAMRRRSHRYDAIRGATMSASIAILALVPLTGLARVDLWRGQHWLLFQPVSWKRGLTGVIVGITAMYVVTFLSNVFAGRLFCGWGCPVGQVSRFGDALATPGQSRARRLLAQLQGGVFGTAFVLAVLAWWVDLAVLWRGSVGERSVAWSLVMVGVFGSYAHARWWRWEFCKTACPIGLYYSFVSPATWYGVHFRNLTRSCIECDACDNVCPVHLAPRDLMPPIAGRGGLALTDAPGRNHCLECGDCVRACELMIETSSRGVEPRPEVPLLLGYFRGPQRIADTAAVTAPAAATTCESQAEAARRG